MAAQQMQTGDEEADRIQDALCLLGQLSQSVAGYQRRSAEVSARLVVLRAMGISRGNVRRIGLWAISVGETRRISVDFLGRWGGARHMRAVICSLRAEEARSLELELFALRESAECCWEAMRLQASVLISHTHGEDDDVR